MSMRRPKAQVIRSDPSDGEEEQKVADQPKKNQKHKSKIKSRMKVVNFGDDEEKYNDIGSLNDLSFHVKKREKKHTFELPLFNQLDTDEPDFGGVHSLGDIEKRASKQKQLLTKKEKVEEPKAEAEEEAEEEEEEEEVDKNLSAAAGTDVSEANFDAIELGSEDKPSIESGNDFISVNVFDREEISPPNSNDDLLDDGRLPVTEKEEQIQKTVLYKEMEEAFYDMEMATDNEMELEDWEESKLKTGKIINSDMKKNPRLPTLNITEADSLAPEINKIKEIMDQIKAKRQDNVSDLERMSEKKLLLSQKSRNIVEEIQNIVLDLDTAS